MKVCQETKDYMKKFKKQLKDRGLLEDVDSLAIDLIEFNHHKLVTSTQIILEQGSTYEVFTASGSTFRARPEVKMAQEATIQLKSLLIEFGGTSKSRGKVIAPVVEDTELDAFFKAEKR